MSGGTRRIAVSRKRSTPLTGWAAIALLLLMAIAALPSAWGLMNPAPNGDALGMPVEFLKNTPFTSYFIPGLILFVVIGLGSLVAALAGILKHPLAPYLSAAIGGGLMIWIVVQYLMIQMYSFLQPVIFVWGALIVVLTYFWWRSTRSR
jgi:hypothetical protein